MTTKHFYKLPLLTFLVSAGLLTACSSDDDNTAGGDLQSPETPIRIEVEVNEEPIVDTSDQARETRGTATTTATLSEFKMYAVHDASIDKEYSVLKNGNTWTIKPNNWPSNNLVDFYANTGGTFYLNSGDPYVRFEVAENASTQHDLLVAKKMQQPRPTDGVGKVSLTFSHACAAVAFNVQITKTLHSQIGSNLSVNSIKLFNVYSEGKHFINSRKWEYITDNGTEQPVKSFYTLSNSNISVTTEYQPLSSNDIFVIPQSRTADGTNGMYLEINYSNNTKSAIIPLNVEWLAGYRYIVNIRLGIQQIEH